MDSPAREKEEMDEYVLVPDAADELDEDADDVYDHEARLLVGNNETTIENYFASEPTPKTAAQCGMVEAPAPSGVESEGSVDDDVKTVDGGPSDEGSGTEEVGVAEEPECKQGEGDHGCQQHAVGVICSQGLAAAATGLASNSAAQCGTAEAVAPSGAESEDSVDDDVEAVDGGLSDEGTGTEEVGVAEEPECKQGEGDHGCQQHAVGVICSHGLAAAATGLASNAAAQCGTAEAVAPSGAESEGFVDDDVEAVDGGLSYEGLAAEEVGVAEEPECKDGDGDHGTTWQKHAAGVIRSLGFAAFTGLAVLLISQQKTPHRVHFRFAGDRKAAKVSARRDARRGSGYKF